MYCKICGTEISDDKGVCLKCNTDVVKTNDTPFNEKNYYEENSSSKLSTWFWLSIVSLICACFTFCKGIDKMIHYDSGDYYPYKSVNAYVGGDAYNYIINGTYATSFFVLTTMFVIAGIGFLIVHYLSKK